MNVHKKSPSESLPNDFRLLPGERIIPEKTYQHPKRNFDKTPSSIEQLLRLTGAKNERSIGATGPSVASLALGSRAGTTKKKRLVSKLTNLLVEPTNAAEMSAPDHLHLFEVVFGRDSLRVAIDLISNYPELARATTLRLAELQGVAYDVSSEEEPGRIVHEARDENDALAIEITKNRGWKWPYYGSVDATPEFVRTLTAYCRRTEENTAFLSHPSYIDRAGQRRTMAYALDMALEWITTKLDSNDEGIIEYKSTLSHGIENQVWKDSPDSYHHADGTLANRNQGIASVEVQVTTYDALLDAAQLYEDAYGDMDRGQLLRERATQLSRAIIDIFCTEDKGGYFVLGTDRDDDGQLRQLKIRTSNMGHVLNSRLLEGDDPEYMRMREAVIRHILSPEMLNISGIRTLANDEIRFRPGAYHNGSVWLWDTHHIAKGLRRHGHSLEANEIDRRLLHIVEMTKLFPEYVRGGNDLIPTVNDWTITVYDDALRGENVIEQPPQEVQAWTVAAILAIKKRINRESRLSDSSLDKLTGRLRRVAQLPRRLSTQTRPAADTPRRRP